MSAYKLNLSACDANHTKEPDIAVTPTTPTTTILTATYEVLFTAYQIPVIAYDPYQVNYPILINGHVDLDRCLRRALTIK